MSAAALAAAAIRRHAVRARASLTINGDPVAGGAMAIRVTNATADAALIERDAHPAEGGPAIRRARLSMADAATADARIAATVEAIARLQRREAALGGQEPPWSFTVSSSTATALRHLGVDAAALAVPGSAAAWGRHPAVEPAVPGVDVRLVGSRLVANALTFPATGRAPAMRLDETSGLPTLTVLAPLPHALVPGCAGRPLGEVIGHPALAAEPTILRMTHGLLGAPEIRVVLEDVREAVGAGPAATASWLDVGQLYTTRPLFV